MIKIAPEWNMTQVITQAAIEAAKMEILIVRETEVLTKVRKVMHAAPRVSRPSLKQPTFNWKVTDKYDELIIFEMDVRNIFMMDSYYTDEDEKVPIIMSCLLCEGLSFILTPISKKYVE